MSFGADVLAFGQKSGIRLDTVVRKVVIDMTSDIVKATPVLTGHAMSNWFWGSSRLTDEDPAEDKNGGPSIKRALDFAGGLSVGGVLYLTNNVSYIMALEYGHSKKQAPAGMARITVARWQEIVNKIVAGIR